ncbi:MAG: alpha-amylase family glycosyl hydrolase [Ferruginibacter sp.]
MNNTNIYEVNIRQYTAEGTIAAFKKHLPRLKEMGVQVLWFMPIHPIGEINRKGTLGSYYSIKNYKQVNPEFGNEEDFKDLVETAHSMDMKVIIDWVANHAAWDNDWTLTNPDFFLRDEAGNFKAPFDWDDVIQVDHSNEMQQDAMIASMQFWIDNFDIDGFRADLAHLTPLPFWKNARHLLDTLKPGLIWLAETEEPNYHEAFDISYTWEWMHACEKFVKKETTVTGLVELLKRQKENFPLHAMRLFFTTNHDENSWNGTEYEKFGRLAKAFAVFSFMYGGIPLIYSGQEIPNTKRLKFFDKDWLEWPDGPALHNFFSTLIEVRLFNPAFPGEINFIEEHAEENILAFKKRNGDNDLIVLLNLGEIYFDGEFKFDAEGTFIEKFSNASYKVENKRMKVFIESGGFLVLEKK